MFKLNNRELVDRLFKHISENSKFKPYNIEYGDTYFVFTGEPNSVIHFRMKGVNKHWKFGMWVHSEYIDDDNFADESVIQFFAQWDRNIDKFKPSRSDICVTIKAKQFNTEPSEEWLYSDIIDTLIVMKRHPILCYNGICGNECVGYLKVRSFTFEFIKEEFYHFKQTFVKAIKTAIFLPICKLKVWRAKQYDCVNFIEMFNFEKRNIGWSSDRDYEIACKFKHGADTEEMEKVARIFKRYEWGKYAYYRCVVKLDYFTQVGKKGCFTFDFD